MSENRNYTLNFSSGRDSLNFPAMSGKLASTEVSLLVSEPLHG
jgi:hypothetical protein